MKHFFVAMIVGGWLIGGFGDARGVIRAQEPSQRRDWSSLQYRTGWVMVGDLDIASQKWATLLRFRIAKRVGIGPNPLIPMPGDVLQITREGLDVFILDYKTTGEQKRLVSPGEMPVDPSWATGVRPTKGSFVIVNEVTITDPFRGVQFVWARVSPVEN